MDVSSNTTMIIICVAMCTIRAQWSWLLPSQCLQASNLSAWLNRYYWNFSWTTGIICSILDRTKYYWPYSLSRTKKCVINHYNLGSIWNIRIKIDCAQPPFGFCTPCLYKQRHNINLMWNIIDLPVLAWESQNCVRFLHVKLGVRGSCKRPFGHLFSVLLSKSQTTGILYEFLMKNFDISFFFRSIPIYAKLH